MLLESITRQVKTLAGGGADDAAIRQFRRRQGEYRMPVVVIQVEMDLVGEHIEVVLPADFAQGFQLVPGPYSATGLWGEHSISSFASAAFLSKSSKSMV